MDMNEIMLWALGVPVVLIVVHVLLWKHFTSKVKQAEQQDAE